MSYTVIIGLFLTILTYFFCDSLGKWLHLPANCAVVQLFKLIFELKSTVAESCPQEILDLQMSVYITDVLCYDLLELSHRTLCWSTEFLSEVILITCDHYQVDNIT